jgi:hypothetical protein
MNVWIRKLMRRKGLVKEGYDRRSLTGRGGILGGGRIIGRGGGGLYVGGDYFSGVGSLFYGFLVNQKQGAPICWGFWAWGLGYPYGILELGSQTGCS